MMANRINGDYARKTDKRTDRPRTYTNSNQASLNIDRVDDVIAYLANAHENRRARQVTEWERLGGRQVQHTV